MSSERIDAAYMQRKIALAIATRNHSRARGIIKQLKASEDRHLAFEAACVFLTFPAEPMDGVTVEGLIRALPGVADNTAQRIIRDGKLGPFCAQQIKALTPEQRDATVQILRRYRDKKVSR